MTNMTAVEWLYEQIKLTDKETYNSLYEQYQQANKMFEQQIIDAYQKGFTREFGNRDEDAKQYYSETYKKDNT